MTVTDGHFDGMVGIVNSEALPRGDLAFQPRDDEVSEPWFGTSVCLKQPELRHAVSV
jgi:hypothetical protein